MLRAIVLRLRRRWRVAGAEQVRGVGLVPVDEVTLMEVVAAAEVSVSVSVAVTVRVMACVDSPVVRVRPES